MPTSTDVIIMGSHPLQVIAATTPNATLFWDDNNGHKGSFTISNFPVANKVLLDDIALAINQYNDVYAYITCRVLLANGTTEIHLFTFLWDQAANAFVLTPIPTLIDIRLTSVDIIDGVRLSINNYDYMGSKVDIVWQEGGNILLNEGYINFIAGNIDYSSGVQNHQIYDLGLYPGSFSNPDISNYGPATGTHIAVVAKYKNGAEKKVVTASFDGLSNVVFIDVYSTFLNFKEIRTPRIEFPRKYRFIIIFNEIDFIVQKSTMKLVSGSFDGYVSPTLNINSDLELNCLNNYNYKLTGFPSIKITNFLIPSSFDFEVVWQQVKCFSGDFCQINAVSKRFNYYAETHTISSSALFSNQYFEINNDLSKNSFFPSLASDFYNCKVYYSFNLMDKNTNLNGLVGYKKSDCNSTSLKTSENTNNKEEPLFEKPLNEFKVFPNPAINELNIVNNKIIATIEAFNLAGVLMKRINVNNNVRVTLNTSKWSSGQYVLKIYNKDGSFKIEKIIVNH